MLTILLPTIYLSFAQAQLQSCSDGGIGPCVADICPVPTATCITAANGRICCENSKIINVTTPAPTTTTTSATCTDLVNPRTGVSDCPNRAYLCNNSIYYNLMTQQCPKTCNRCGAATTTPSTACADLVNPRTGVSDCPSRANLCNNSVYYNLMTQQCPKTCNRCGAATTASPRACADLVNPSTGVSDCPSKANLCSNSVYYTLMTQQCPRTCNRCS